jgi:uncharacterized membrane protein (UPF0127 family)
VKFPLLLVLLSAAIIVSACQSAPRSYPAPAFIAGGDCEDREHDVLPVASLTIAGPAGTPGNIDITLQVEIADEPSERAQGLMCRESVSPGTGMLFTYESDRSSGFWMFNTYTPIDILYLDQLGGVVDKITMSPCPRGQETDGEWWDRCLAESSRYVPSGPWRTVLELPAGWLEEQGLRNPVGTGVTVSWDAPDEQA